MATQLLNLPAYLANDADFRTWGKAISDALAFCGLVKSADTGQIDWTTVARPSGGGNFAGYEIWRFSDTEQATMPVFIKLEYGGSAPDIPNLAWTVGTATNGTGTITGQSILRRNASISNSRSPGEKLNTYISATNGRFALVAGLDPNSSQYMMGFLVGRTLDGQGAPTTEGIFTYMWSPSSGLFLYQIVPVSGSLPAQSTGSGSFPVPPFKGGLSSRGTDIALGMPTLMIGKVRYSDIALVYEHADIGELVPFQANVLGVQHTYLPLGDGGAAHGIGNFVPLAMMWE